MKNEDLAGQLAVAAEAEFRARFAAAFLASWCAGNYQDGCSGVIEGPPGNRGAWWLNMPVEDAAHLAGEAWELWSAER